MAIAVASIDVLAESNSSSIVLTKPASTVSGDLLLVHIMTRNDGGGTGGNSINSVPSGWTLGKYQAGTGSSVNQTSQFYWLVAGGSEPSTYTFGQEGGYFCRASIWRITGAATTSPIDTTNGSFANNVQNPSINATVTPSIANSLVIQFWAGTDGVTSVATYAIATDNPTWTEGYDVSQTNGGSSTNRFVSAYAIRTQTTATGNTSAAGSNSSNDWALVMVVIKPLTSTNYTLTAALGTFTLTSIETVLKLGIKILAAVGTFTLTGVSSILRFGRKITAAVGAFTLTYINVTTLFGKILTATTGAFVLTGIAANIRSTRNITAAVGTFTLTGINNIMIYGRVLTAAVGAYVLTLNTVIVTGTRKIVAAVGAFVLTGVNVSFPRASKIFANTGVFILSGQDAILRRGKKMVAAVGTFTLTGVAALFPRASKIFALTGTFTLTGYSARGLVNGLTNFWHASTKHISTWINKLKS